MPTFFNALVREFTLEFNSSTASLNLRFVVDKLKLILATSGLTLTSP